MEVKFQQFYPIVYHRSPYTEIQNRLVVTDELLHCVQDICKYYKMLHSLGSVTKGTDEIPCILSMFVRKKFLVSVWNYLPISRYKILMSPLTCFLVYVLLKWAHTDLVFYVLVLIFILLKAFLHVSSKLPLSIATPYEYIYTGVNSTSNMVGDIKTMTKTSF